MRFSILLSSQQCLQIEIRECVTFNFLLFKQTEDPDQHFVASALFATVPVQVNNNHVDNNYKEIWYIYT